MSVCFFLVNQRNVINHRLSLHLCNRKGFTPELKMSLP